MKLSAEKIALLFIPYLLALSIFYNNGYWSMFSLSVFNYYEAQDIIKDIAWPLFRFGGLLVIPLLISAFMTASLTNTKEDVKKQEQKVSESEQINKSKNKNRKLVNNIVYVLKFAIAIILFVIVFIFVIFIITIAFYPVEDEIDFTIKYISSINQFIFLRLFLIIYVGILGIDIIAMRVQGIGKRNSTKVAVVFTCIALTFFISYHYGRIDAYKIISGTDFRFWIDNKGVGHKYLAKINDSYFFLADTKYIKNRNSAYDLDTLGYDNRITIISKDTLKSVELDYYGSHTVSSSSAFNKAFVARD